MKTVLIIFSEDLKKSLPVLLSVAALLLGGIIYLLFRSTDIVILHLINESSLYNWILSIRHKFIASNNYLPEWFIYSFPDGCWAFAYTLIIARIWLRSSSILKYFWLGTIPVLVFGFETLQYHGILPGTFSNEDMVSSVLGILAGIFIGIKTTNLKHHEKVFI